MTERFYTDGQYVMQDGEVYVICNGKHNADVVATALNESLDKNEQLKHEYDKLKHRHSLLHDVCIEAECDRDSLKKDVISLEKENENLNNILEDFMVMLNRLQADSDNEVLQSMAKDMLQMMGKDIIGDLND